MLSGAKIRKVLIGDNDLVMRDWVLSDVMSLKFRIVSFSFVMLRPACEMAGICGCGSLFPLPFLLKEKEQKFKADIIGPNTQSGRFPAMSAVARAPSPDQGRHSRSWSTKQPFQDCVNK